MVTDSVIMPNSTVGCRARVEYSIVGERCKVGEGARIGAPNDGSEGWGVAVVGHDKTIAEGSTIKPKEIV